MSETLFGFQRLAQMHGLSLAQPLFSFSRLGAVRQRAVTPQGEALTWPPQYQPEDTFRGHFEFGLKYERLNLEFFSRLFARIDPAEVAAWVKDEPTGRYARRAAFLYEWFTGDRLNVPDTAANVGYVEAIDHVQDNADADGQPLKARHRAVIQDFLQVDTHDRPSARGRVKAVRIRHTQVAASRSLSPIEKSFIPTPLLFL